MQRVGGKREWLPTAVWMQAPVSAGDLVVEHSGGGAFYVQVKYRKAVVSVTPSSTGLLSEVLAQFAQQFVGGAGHGEGGHNPWERPFDSTRDRLMLVVPSSAGVPLTRHVANLLNRLREPNAWAITNQRFNETEHRLVQTLREVSSRVLASVGAAQVQPEDFLRCVGVVSIDVDEDSAGAGEARVLLESSVLTQSSGRGAEAWQGLRQIAREANRGGHRLAVSDIASKLQSLGLPLRVPRAYERSIENLKRATAKNLLRLKRYAQLRVGAGKVVEIPRDCSTTLREATEVHRVVIGQPGAGKSGVIYQVCERLLKDGRDVVLLLADDLQASSDRPLREVLELDTELADVLAAWPGGQPAHLVIDALDAARDPRIARQLRTSMAQVMADETRWRVLASVRRFDLKHSPETRDLFAGSPVSEFKDKEFGDTAHFNVPALSDAELAQAAQEDSALEALLRTARRNVATIELLKQPFNLSLACELIRAEVSVERIVPFDTKTVLLDKFWNWRVQNTQPQGAEREAALGVMIKELMRKLAMRIPDDRSPTNRATMVSLAEHYVLDPEAFFRDGELRFSHHLLHDYAVSRLFFRPLPTDEMVVTLSTRPELSVYARQSLLLHFDHLWEVDSTRQKFWAASLKFIRSTLPLVARILTTECVVRNASRWADFSTLTERLAAKDSAAEDMLRFVVSGFLDLDDAEQQDRSASAWVALAEHLAEHLPHYHWQVHLLLMKLAPDSDETDKAYVPGLNRAACRLARIMASKPTREEQTGPEYLTALRVACQTAPASPTETEAILRPLLQREFAEQFGDRVYWVVAEKIKHLFKVLPEFVQDFYVAVYSFDPPHEGWESLGRSKILPLQVRRRDNYQMAHHRLQEVFAAFMSAAPILATTAVLRIMPTYRAREHPRVSGEEDPLKTFQFRGRECRLAEDLSSIWASDSSSHADDAVSLLRAGRNGWVALAREKRSELLEQLADLWAKEAELAVIWREVLEAGKRAPESLGRLLAPLLKEQAILTSTDTHYQAAALLEVVFPLLEHEARSEIERALIALPKNQWQGPDDALHEKDSWRGLYLNQIPPRVLVSDEAKALRRELAKAKALRKNSPPFRSWSSTGRMDWTDYVPSLKSVDLKTPVHIEAKTWEDKLKALAQVEAKKHTLQSLDAMWPDLEGAYAFAVTRRPVGLHADVAQLIWAQLIAVIENVVRSGVPIKDPVRLDFLRSALLRAAVDPQPEPDPEADASFARMPSWGSPSPRIDAAQALIVWPRETGEINDSLRDAIRALARDPHPAVRFQIAGSCNALYEADRPFMWELIRERTTQEQNVGVWSGWLGAMDRIAPGHKDEAATLFLDYLRRFPRGDESGRDPADQAVGGLGALFIRSGHPSATEFVMGMVNEPAKHAHNLGQLCHQYRDTLAMGLVPDATPFQRELHQRGVDFFLRLVRNARAQMERLIEQDRNGTPPSAADVKAILELLNNLNMQVFFASGAHGAKSHRDEKDGPPPPIPEFWRDTRSIIDELVCLPSAHIAYHLTETLEYLVPADPAELFRCVVKVVENSKLDGFAREHLAVGVISRIVERYLADHVALFTSQPDLMAGLLRVLDTFAEVGWPEARRLIRNLSQLYR